MAHGVNADSRVLVGHPFEPWAIGGVFRDAALRCGASVLPFGLSFREPSLQAIIANFDPNVLCCSANLLAEWAKHAPIKRTPNRLVFHAGEILRRHARLICSQYLSAEIVDVYGMAEFDTVAAQGPAKPGLVLAPRFDYALRKPGASGRPSRITGQGDGELLLRARGSRRWHATGDHVRVASRVGRNERLWPGSWRVEVIGRLDDCVTLPDGGTISAQQVGAALERVRGVRNWQVQVHRRDVGGTEVHVAVLNGRPSAGNTGRQVRQQLLSGCLELADSLRHGVVNLSVSVSSRARFVRTARGKMRSVLEVTT